MVEPGFVRVIAAADLAPGACTEVAVEGRALALYNVGGQFYATANQCLHRGGPLGQGMLDGTAVWCPWHAWSWDVRTGENEKAGLPATNFSVVRVKRDLFQRSYVGVIGTHRSQSVVGTSSNTAFGLDTNLALSRNLNVLGYYAETRTPGLGAGRSHRGRFDYEADRLGVQVERLAVGSRFNPEVGFMRRSDFIQHLGQFRLSHRPASLAAVRRVSLETALDYITDNELRLQNRQARVAIRTEMENSDAWTLQYTSDFEWVDRPFPVVGTLIPAGVYRYSNARGSYTLREFG